MSIRNIVPQGRTSQSKDKDVIEKTRLMERKAGFVKYEPDTILKPFEIDQKSEAYMDDSERFHTDVSGEERRMRMANLEKERKTEDAKRLEKLEREEARWNKEIEKDMNETAKWEAIRNDPNNPKARRNYNSMPCDPITLDYAPNADGQKLKYADDLIKYRASGRAESLRNHSNSNFNPITGDPIQLPARPNPPEKPDCLRDMRVSGHH